MNSKAHWEAVYGTKAPTELSWYESRPTRSLELLSQLGIGASTAIIDVGGGASTLVDALLDLGCSNVTVLDISSAALAHAKARLGTRASSIERIEADVTRAELGVEGRFDVWHDRAAFHFLTDRDD